MHIGDLLFNTPCFRLLKRNFPESEIDLIINKKNFLLVKNNFCLNQIISLSKKQSFFELIELIRTLRKVKYDLVINFHENERASLITSLVNSHKKIGLAKSLFRVFFDQVYQRKQSSTLHQVEEYLEITKLLKLENLITPEIEVNLGNLDLSSSFLKNSSQKLQELNKKKRKIIGLNTGGSWRTKQWGLNNFRELAQLLIKKKHFLVFLGSKEDQVRSQKIISFLDHKFILDLTGQTDLLETAYFMNFCSIVISGDSGPLHLAISQKRPVLGIFGPSNLKKYFPYGQKKNTISLENLFCLGCGLHSCTHHSCMRLLSSKKILERTLKILEQNN